MSKNRFNKETFKIVLLGNKNNKNSKDENFFITLSKGSVIQNLNPNIQSARIFLPNDEDSLQFLKISANDPLSSSLGAANSDALILTFDMLDLATFDSLSANLKNLMTKICVQSKELHIFLVGYSAEKFNEENRLQLEDKKKNLFENNKITGYFELKTNDSSDALKAMIIKTLKDTRNIKDNKKKAFNDYLLKRSEYHKKHPILDLLRTGASFFGFGYSYKQKINAVTKYLDNNKKIGALTDTELAVLKEGKLGIIFENCHS